MSRKSKERERLRLARQYKSADVIAENLARMEREYPDKSLAQWREETAWHEAGHAVVGELFDHRIDFVTCEPLIYKGEFILGIAMVGFRKSKVITTRWGLRGYLMHLFAGPAVEHVRGTMPEGGMPETDIRAAASIFDQLPFPTQREKDEFLTAATEDARHVVEVPPVWAAIQEVAERMIVEGTLSGAEVRKIAVRHVSGHLLQQRKKSVASSELQKAA